MPDKRISQNELNTYWKIFSANANGSSHLDSHVAVNVLRNSKLPDDQLEAVWDLADFDSDGKLDFEEFCVAMKLTFQLVNGEISRAPETLPDWLVPESKAHLVQANRALKNPSLRHERTSYDDDEDDDEEEFSLKDGFDWYMSPEDRHKYEEIYTANRNHHGEISFSDLDPLYSSLDVPDTDLRSAWNLINPSAEETIGKDSCLTFLHILNNRHQGYRVPRTIPASLRVALERGKVDYRVDNRKKSGPISAADRWGVSSKDDSTITGRKAKFGDEYLSRLGIGDRSRLAIKKTDFSSTPTTEDWEVVRLKNQLKEIEEKMKAVEESKERRTGSASASGQNKSKPALVKRELEQMLDYKRRELRELEDGGGSGGPDGLNMNRVQEDIQSIRDQVTGLESHLRRRQDYLADLKRQIQEEQSAAH